MYIAWFTIVFVVLSLAGWYVGWRLIVPAKLALPWNVIAWVGLAIMIILPVASSILMRTNAKLIDPFSWIAYVGLGFFSLTITFLLGRDLLWLGSLVIEKGAFFAQKLFSETPPRSADPLRREFLLQVTNLGIIGAAGILTAYGIY